MPTTEANIDAEKTQTASGDRVTGPVSGPISAPPTEIAGYRVVGLLGRGNMGEVYQCHDRSLDRMVAIKVIAPHAAASRETRRRFEREARLAAKLCHRNTVQVFASGTAGRAPYLVMELIEGESVQERIQRDGRLKPREAFRIASQAARGLAAAHAAELIHRDIKPSNILLTTAGEVKVADFGLARPETEDAGLTSAGMVVGTPHYMSPEQVQGEPPLDFRSDMYSLGVTLYHMLTGTTPYADGSPFSIAARHVSEPFPELAPRVPGLPLSAVAVVTRLTEKDRDARYGSWEEAIAAIDAVVSRPAGSQTMAMVGAKTATQQPRLPAPVFITGIALLLLAGASFAYWLDTIGGDPTSAPAFPIERPIPANSIIDPATTRPVSEPGPVGLSEVPAPAGPAFYQRYDMPNAAAPEWTATGLLGLGHPRIPPHPGEGHLQFNPGGRAELWSNHAVSGDKSMTVVAELQPNGSVLVMQLLLRETSGAKRWAAMVGFPELPRGRRFPRQTLDQPLPPPTAKLFALDDRGGRVMLASAPFVTFRPGRIDQLTLEHRGGRLRLLHHGSVIVEVETGAIATSQFGLGFGDSGGRLITVELAADRAVPFATRRD